MVWGKRKSRYWPQQKVVVAVAPLLVAGYHDGSSQQIHLSLGVNSSEMVVTWATASNETGRTSVRVWETGKENVSSWEVEPWWTRRYSLKKGVEVDRIVKDYESPWLYSARVQGLRPESVFEYQVDAGPTYQFRTPAAAGRTYPTRLAVLGDVGQTNFSNATVAELKAHSPRPSAALLVGDLSYADGDNDRWDAWERLVEPLFGELPLAPLPGNHEVEFEDDGSAFTAYRFRYPAPGASPPEETKRGVFNHNEYDADLEYDFGASYYGFDVGPLRIVALNSYVPAEKGSRQRAFVERELACVDRSKTPWVIVGLHAPWYSTNAKHRVDVERNAARHRAGLEKVLASGGAVPVVFAGHVHAYERSHPVCDDALHPRGPTYVTVGDGGNREQLYDVWPYARDEPWSAFRNGTRYGYGVFEVFNDTDARWVWLPNDLDGERDAVDLKNTFYASPHVPPCYSDDDDDDDGFVFDCAADLVAEIDRRAASYPRGTDSNTSTARKLQGAILAVLLLAVVALAVALAHTFVRAACFEHRSDGYGGVELVVADKGSTDDPDSTMV